MNAATAKQILAVHDLAIRDAINARDAIDNCMSPEWRAAHAAAGAACAARRKEVARLAAMEWEGRDPVGDREMTLFGRMLRRHTDPVRVTWSDLHGR